MRADVLPQFPSPKNTILIGGVVVLSLTGGDSESFLDELIFCDYLAYFTYLAFGKGFGCCCFCWFDGFVYLVYFAYGKLMRAFATVGVSFFINELAINYQVNYFRTRKRLFIK